MDGRLVALLEEEYGVGRVYLGGVGLNFVLERQRGEISCGL